MSLAFFRAERSLVLMTLLTLNRSEQIYQALKNQYAHRYKSKPIIFCDSHCFFLLRCIQEVLKMKKSERHS